MRSSNRFLLTLLLPLPLLMGESWAREYASQDDLSRISPDKSMQEIHTGRLTKEPTSESGRAEYPCPDEVAIEPCVCSIGIFGQPSLDCTWVESNAQLASVFQQTFPVKEFYQFSMANNSGVTALGSFLNGVTFQDVYLNPGPFALEAIEAEFLLDLQDTLYFIDIQNSQLTTESFAFDVLPLVQPLNYFYIHGSNMNRIPPIQSSGFNTLGVDTSQVELLEAGTISIGTGRVTVHLSNNLIRSIEPGTFTFAAHNSTLTNDEVIIYLTGNQLQSLQAGTFPIKDRHVTINLYFNQISTIEPGAFNITEPIGASSIQELTIQLSNNALQSLQAGSLPLRNGRGYIYLHYNQISSIEPGTFVMPQATDAMSVDLWLHNNNLTTFDEEVFGELMPHILFLELYSNPLTCGCDLAWIVLNPDYMIKVDFDATCADGRYLHSLDPAYFVAMC